MDTTILQNDHKKKKTEEKERKKKAQQQLEKEKKIRQELENQKKMESMKAERLRTNSDTGKFFYTYQNQMWRNWKGVHGNIFILELNVSS